MRDDKLFIGRRVREIRTVEAMTQGDFATALGFSKSYLNQIENDQRPVSAGVLLALAERFGVDVGSLSGNETDRLAVDLGEALADPLFESAGVAHADIRAVARGAPALARAFLLGHQALRRTSDRLAGLDETLERNGGLATVSAYDEVRDWFHYAGNYVHELDVAGEALAESLERDGGRRHEALVARLARRHGIRVVSTDAASAPPTEPVTPALLRRFDAAARTLALNSSLPVPTRDFQLAHQIALLEHHEALDRIVSEAGFRSAEGGRICRMGLANFVAGATLLPYARFAAAARAARHDLQRLGDTFEASVEQVAHRLSTLQRPGACGVPFFFARVDAAGNIVKRHSATSLSFARFGSACPLWNVHGAFETPDRIVRQLASTPDGTRYLCVATTTTKRTGGFGAPLQRYALALGCEVRHAREIVYADGLDIERHDAYERIGVSCRTCEREHCHQRAMPPLSRDIVVDPDRRGTIPYSLG